MKDKVLFVVTSCGALGQTGKPTGYWLSEVTHPWSVLMDRFDIDVVSPEGARPPVTGFDLSDPINKQLWDSPEWQDKMSTTMTPDQVDPTQYKAIFYAGGHGAVWDFPWDRKIAEIARTIYENGGYVSAVCHGPAGLINVYLSDGKPLIMGKKMVSFTNAEEKANGTLEVVPFLLQTALESRQCIFEAEAPWSNNVITDGRLITGQNPQSALSLGKALLKALTEQ